MIIDYSKNIDAELISIMSDTDADGKFMMGSAAQQMLNKHVVKMPTETCQMLHTNALFNEFTDRYGYEPTLSLSLCHPYPQTQPTPDATYWPGLQTVQPPS